MRRFFYAAISLFLCIGSIHKSLAQINYPLCLSTGYRFDSAYSNSIQDLTSVIQDTDGVYHLITNSGYTWTMSFSVDSSHNFTNLKFDYPGINDPVGGFMTKDNPGGYPFYPGYTTGFTSDVYNNTYDSVHRIFYLHYGYSANGSTDEDSFVTQIYKKIVPYPSIGSFSPQIGPAGTAVTIKGWGFLNVNYVTFNNVASDFTIVSDSVIIAKAPVGAGAGIIMVSLLENKNPDPYVIGDRGSAYTLIPFTYQSSDSALPSPRSIAGLYSQGDTTACIPWVKDSLNWTSYLTTDSNGTHLEMQTLFQDEPGNLCGFQSLAADTSVARANIWWAGFDPLYPYFGNVYKQRIEYFSRNYRISFGDTVFAHPVGVRLFFTTAELNRFTNRKAQRGESGGDINGFFIIRYDGPNEDTDLYNNADDSTDYTMIRPAFFYYGPNNEYCYFEFYTDRFSEFQIATLAGAISLPVKILDFSAAVQNHVSNLRWQTADEMNTAYFTVQRSIDGIHFINIDKVNAAGTDGNHNYRYRDDVSALNSASKVYYRLLITDKDGSIKTSSIASVDLADSKLITIHPNPARSYAVITCNTEGKKTITITDMNGRKMFVKTTANNSETIGVSSFAKGVYVVRTDYANGYSIQKLVVE